VGIKAASFHVCVSECLRSRNANALHNDTVHNNTAHHRVRRPRSTVVVVAEAKSHCGSEYRLKGCAALDGAYRCADDSRVPGYSRFASNFGSWGPFTAPDEMCATSNGGYRTWLEGLDSLVSVVDMLWRCGNVLVVWLSGHAVLFPIQYMDTCLCAVKNLDEAVIYKILYLL
jgi:hypothetical protein